MSLSDVVTHTVRNWMAEDPTDAANDPKMGNVEFEVRLSSREAKDGRFTHFSTNNSESMRAIERLERYLQATNVKVGNKLAKFKLTESSDTVESINSGNEAYRIIQPDKPGSPHIVEAKTKIDRVDNYAYGLRFDLSREVTLDPKRAAEAISLAIKKPDPVPSIRRRRRHSWLSPDKTFKIDITWISAGNYPGRLADQVDGVSNMTLPPGMSNIFKLYLLQQNQKRGQRVAIPDTIRMGNTRLSFTQTDQVTFGREIAIIEVEFNRIPSRKDMSAEEANRQNVIHQLTNAMNILQESYMPMDVHEAANLLAYVQRVLPARRGMPLRAPQPRNLKASNLDALMMNHYGITVKADGEERFIVNDLETGVYLYNRRGVVQKVSDKPFDIQFIAQGELVRSMDTRFLKPGVKLDRLPKATRLHLFDCLMVDHRDIRDRPLWSRMEQADMFVNTLNLHGSDLRTRDHAERTELPFVPLTFQDPRLPFAVTTKRYFYRGDLCKNVEDALVYRASMEKYVRIATNKSAASKLSDPRFFSEQFPLGLDFLDIIPEDGLVFTPMAQYNAPNLPIFKLKPAEENTIDVMLRVHVPKTKEDLKKEIEAESQDPSFNIQQGRDESHTDFQARFRAESDTRNMSRFSMASKLAETLKQRRKEAAALRKKVNANTRAYDIFVSKRRKDGRGHESIQFRGTREHKAPGVLTVPVNFGIKDGGIYEVKFSPSRTSAFGAWTVVRERSDKKFPNELRTILDIWKDIHTPFTFEELRAAVCVRTSAPTLRKFGRMARDIIIEVESEDTRNMSIMGLTNGEAVYPVSRGGDAFVFGVPMPTDQIPRIRASVDNAKMANRFVYLPSFNNLRDGLLRYRQMSAAMADKPMINAGATTEKIFGHMVLAGMFNSPDHLDAAIAQFNSVVMPGGSLVLTFLDGDELVKEFSVDRRTMKPFNNRLNPFDKQYSFTREFNFKLSSMPQEIVERALRESTFTHQGRPVPRPYTPEEETLRRIVPFEDSEKFGLKYSLTIGRDAPIVENLVFGSVLANRLIQSGWEFTKELTLLDVIPPDFEKEMDVSSRNFMRLHVVNVFKRPGQKPNVMPEHPSVTFSLDELAAEFQAKEAEEAAAARKAQFDQMPALPTPATQVARQPASEADELLAFLAQHEAQESGNTEFNQLDMPGLDPEARATLDLLQMLEGVDDATLLQPTPARRKARRKKKSVDLAPINLQPRTMNDLSILLSGERDNLGDVKANFALPGNLPMQRVGVSGDGSCLYHSILQAVDPEYERLSVDAQNEKVAEFRLRVGGFLTTDKYLSLGSMARDHLINAASTAGIKIADFEHKLPMRVLRRRLYRKAGQGQVDEWVAQGLEVARTELADCSVDTESIYLPLIMEFAGVNVYFVVNSNIGIKGTKRMSIMNVPMSDCDVLYPANRSAIMVIQLDDQNGEGVHFETIEYGGQSVFEFDSEVATRLRRLACPAPRGRAIIPRPAIF